MDALVAFLRRLDDVLAIFSDEQAVLRRFEMWPEGRLDAMREACAAWTALRELRRGSLEPPPPPPAGARQPLCPARPEREDAGVRPSSAHCCKSFCAASAVRQRHSQRVRGKEDHCLPSHCGCCVLNGINREAVGCAGWNLCRRLESWPHRCGGRRASARGGAAAAFRLLRPAAAEGGGYAANAGAPCSARRCGACRHACPGAGSRAVDVRARSYRRSRAV